MEARMSGALSPTDWTWDEYARLPDDGNRYEVLDGEVLVTPAPGIPHQRVAARLFGLLSRYVDAHGVGEMLWDVDLLFAKGQFLRPDMLFVPRALRDALPDRGVDVTPGLVVEVLSPSSGHNDLQKKPGRYIELGVPAYWVVDATHRVVLVWSPTDMPSPRTVKDSLVWRPDPAVDPLQLEVQALFADPAARSPQR
jgi:Uma2 family endonuclease